MNDDALQKKVEKIENSNNANQAEIGKLLTHIDYTKERFEKAEVSLLREITLIWKGIEQLKSEIMSIINNALKLERETRVIELQTQKDHYEKDLKRLTLDVLDKEKDLEKQIEEKIKITCANAKSYTDKKIDTLKIMFWSTIALILVSFFIQVLLRQFNVL